MKGKDKGALASLAIVMMALSAGVADNWMAGSRNAETMVMPCFYTEWVKI